MTTTTPDPTAQQDLDDLAARLNRVRRQKPSATPLEGISAERVAALIEVWRDLDYRAVEAEYAGLGSSLTATADGRRLHYLHLRAEGDGLPIVLLHGWPDTPWQFRHLIPLLVAAGHDVVAPTAAGFGLSDEPSGELSPGLVAEDVHTLVTGLGYTSYAVHGTDWGAMVGAALAAAHPDAVAALHLLQPPFDRAFFVDRGTASEAERAYLTHLDQWGQSAAYVSAHTHQADTLAAAFADSPAGLLAWIAEKYDAWSGANVRDEDIVRCVATMWLTDSFRSSVRLYSEPASTWDTSSWDAESEGSADWGNEDAATSGEWQTGDSPASGWEAGEWEPGAGESDAWGAGGDAGSGEWAPARIEVPTAFALFPQDIGTPPREFAERFFDVQRYTVMPRGGHWAALEEPQLVADDVIAFVSHVGGVR
ncbi:MAG: alpha/beta fold hydrolase [Tetrasphaera sp.]